MFGSYDTLENTVLWGAVLLSVWLVLYLAYLGVRQARRRRHRHSHRSHRSLNEPYWQTAQRAGALTHRHHEDGSDASNSPTEAD